MSRLVLPDAHPAENRKSTFENTWSADTASASPKALSHSGSPVVLSPTAPPAHVAASSVEVRAQGNLLLDLLTSSIAIHLIVVAVIGFGVPQPNSRPVRTPPPPAVIEEVKLEPEPVPVDPVKKDETPPPTIESPEPVAAIDLPPVAPVQAIAAVPSTVPVSFGIEVKGPVRWVNDPSQASGAVGGRRQPISLDADGAARNLLLPSLPYPPEAKKRRLTGSLTVEFRTTPTGDIQDVRVRESSGHDELDRAAIENLRKGRWVGPAGFYVKAYEFNLK